LRQLSIDQGRALVQAEGPAALTARRVAGAIGYTPGTLYNVFQDIDALAAAINCVTLEQLGEAIEQIFKHYKEPRVRIAKICAAYLKLHRTEPHLWTLLFAWQVDHASDAYSAAIHRVFDLVVAALLPLSTGRAAACRDAKIVWSTLHGICLLQHSGKLDITVADSPELLVKRFLRSFL
jgi:AcrR family transcriptional regulator